MSVNEYNKYKNNVQSLKQNFSLFTKRIYIFQKTNERKKSKKRDCFSESLGVFLYSILKF